MAKDKKSFILYTDLIHTVSKLPNDKAGELFKYILEYVNDNDPQTDDLLLQISFEPIKQQLKRDLNKYETYIEKQKANGKKGGRPKANVTQKTQAFISKPKKADSVNDNDSVNVNDNVNEINIAFDVFWNLYDKKVGSRERLTKKWNALKDEERKSIIAYIPKYKISQPEKKFRKNPETFLNQKSWNDEIIETGNGKAKDPFAINNDIANDPNRMNFD